jgi:hypothetical protein
MIVFLKEGLGSFELNVDRPIFASGTSGEDSHGLRWEMDDEGNWHAQGSTKSRIARLEDV